MSSYGPTGQPQQPPQPYSGGPQPYPGQPPQPYAGGPQPYPGQPPQQQGPWGGAPRRNGKVGLLIGLGVVLVVIVGGAVVWLTQRGDDGGSAAASSPSAADVPRVGGETTGQAKELSDALTAKGLDCTVRFTSSAGGTAGCFSWTDKGITSTEVLFQYQATGIVTGLNLKATSKEQGVSLTTLATTLQTVAPVVFPTDLGKVAQALASSGTAGDSPFDGTWGRYQVHDGASGSTLKAAASGNIKLTIPTIEMAVPPSRLAAGLTDKGFTCNDAREDCSGTFRGGKGVTSVLSAGLGTGGIQYLIIGADDTSKDASAAATKQAFADLVSTTLGIARGNGVPEVQQWFADHQDGQSHSAYIGGWRVDLVVNYGTPYGASGVASHYRLTVSSDLAWDVPDQ